MPHIMNALLPLAQVDGHPWGHGDWWPWGPIFFGFWILIVAAVVTTVWMISHRDVRHRATSDASGIERAKGILAERFARGEIGVDEYDERLSHLR